MLLIISHSHRFVINQ